MNRPSRTIALSAIAALLAGSAVVLAPPASAAGTDYIVTGTADVDGTPLADVPVTLVAWPNSDTLDALPDDADVPTATVAQARTDSDGRYQLPFDPSTLDASFQDASGVVDLDLVATSGEEDVEWALSADNIHIAPRDGNPGVASPGAPDTVDLSFHRASHTVTVSDALARKQPRTDATGGTARRAAVAGALAAPSTVATFHRRSASTRTASGTLSPHSPGNCSGWKAGVWYRSRTEFYFNAWATSTGPATVREEVGTSHTMGIGASYNGGRWSANGSGHVTDTKGAAAERTYSRNTQVGNTVDYRKFTRACNDNANPSKTDYSYQVRPIQLTFLQSHTAALQLMYYTHCRVLSDGTYTRSSGKSAEYAGGIDLAFVSLNAQAGFDKSTSVSFTLHGATALCGSGTGGFVNSPEVGTRSPSQPQY